MDQENLLVMNMGKRIDKASLDDLFSYLKFDGLAVLNLKQESMIEILSGGQDIRNNTEVAILTFEGYDIDTFAEAVYALCHKKISKLAQENMAVIGGVSNMDEAFKEEEIIADYLLTEAQRRERDSNKKD